MTDRTEQNAIATAQITGDRDNQEDSLATYVISDQTSEHKDERLLVLADGMGGHAGGVETLTEDELVTVLNESDGGSIQTLAGNLMNQIEAAGHPGQDNASVILYQH